MLRTLLICSSIHCIKLYQFTGEIQCTQTKIPIVFEFVVKHFTLRHTRTYGVR